MKCDFTLSFDVDGSVSSEQVCISEHGSLTEESGCMSGSRVNDTDRHLHSLMVHPVVNG